MIDRSGDVGPRARVPQSGRLARRISELGDTGQRRGSRRSVPDPWAGTYTRRKTPCGNGRRREWKLRIWIGGRQGLDRPGSNSAWQFEQRTRWSSIHTSRS